MTLEICGYYETCDGCNSEIIFHWKPSKLEITDKKLSRADGDYAKGLVKIDTHDFIDFLLKSDFLQQHGYRIVKNGGKSDGSEDFDVEIKIGGQIININQRLKS